jgi:hypothetical protein
VRRGTIWRSGTIKTVVNDCATPNGRYSNEVAFFSKNPFR